MNFESDNIIPGRLKDTIAANKVIVSTVSLTGKDARYLIAISWPITCGTFKIKGMRNTTFLFGKYSTKKSKSVNTALTRIIHPIPSPSTQM